MEKLLKLVNELEKRVPDIDKTNLSVSATAVGWHMAHSLLTINQIVEALKNSDPGKYKWKFNLAKTFVYTIGKIPRGRGKAPKSVQPEGRSDSEKLRNQIIITLDKVETMDKLHPDSFFTHPYFGDLNLKPTKTFLIIHTKHHLKIINDINKHRS